MTGDTWLVRHGETEWSRSARHTSVTDVPLTPLGERQAEAVGDRLRGHAFVRVLTSPMARAADTARAAGFGDRAEVSELLAEYRYGAYEGRTTADIVAERPGWELFRDGCPAGESPQDVSARMDALLEAIAGAAGDVLLFGHGHSLRALAVTYLGLDIVVAGALRLDAGTVSILGQEHGHPAIALWNERPVDRPGRSA